MGKTVFLLLLIVGFSINAQTIRYASVSGGGDGTSTGSTWTLTQAIANATAGTTVYVQEGNYGELNLTQSNNGTSGNPIRFIGVDSSWSTISYGDYGTYPLGTETLASTDMPYLVGDLVDGGITTSGYALVINGDYVTFENFAIYGFERGVRALGDNITLKNVNLDFFGDMRDNNATAGFTYYLGRAIDIVGDNVLFENSLVRDADAQNVTINGANGTYRNITTYRSADITNPTDYPFLFAEGAINNEAYDIRCIREYGVAGAPHGINFKPISGSATGNVIDGFYIENSWLELMFTGTTGNVIKNGHIDGTTSQSLADWESGIKITNGADSNTLENIRIENVHAAISFMDYEEGQTVAQGDAEYAGNDNSFINFTVDNAYVAVIYARHGPSGIGGWSNNKFYNWSVNNSARMFRVANPNSGNGFYNMTVKDITSAWLLEEAGNNLNTNTVFDYVNTTGFTAPNLTSYVDSNITTIAYSYTDVANGNFSPTSDVLDVGGDFTGTESRQGFDFRGYTRTSPFTLGAYEYDGTLPTSEENTITSNAAKKRVFYMKFFDN